MGPRKPKGGPNVAVARARPCRPRLEGRALVAAPAELRDLVRQERGAVAARGSAAARRSDTNELRGFDQGVEEGRDFGGAA